MFSETSFLTQLFILSAWTLRERKHVKDSFALPVSSTSISNSLASLISLFVIPVKKSLLLFFSCCHCPVASFIIFCLFYFSNFITVSGSSLTLTCPNSSSLHCQLVIFLKHRSDYVTCLLKAFSGFLLHRE